MKKLLRAVFSGWTLVILGWIAFALVVWIVGPLVAIGSTLILQSIEARLALILGSVALYLLFKTVQAWRARRINRRLLQGLAQRPADAPAVDGPGEAEVRLLSERFDAALARLERARFDTATGRLAAFGARFGRRHLYELPWYLIIGAPGSGKTTALKHSGLRFVLDGDGADPALAGVGGTRNCDWWFASEAVLLDTAGRYATQDSDQAADRGAWLGFLDLLKRSRPHQPVNGVMVTVSVADLLTRNAAQRDAHAAALRARVQELHERLGIRFPIYLLVTKADLLAGFVDLFGDLDAERRAEPWGLSFPLDAKGRSDTSGFGHEFDALVQRLQDGLFERLERERDPQRRARIYAFPAQLAALRALLQRFIDQVFAGSQFESHPLLRGAYLISGTQEGTPIDRLLGRIGRSVGVDVRSVPANPPSGRSFFLGRLLREVVFAEAGLGGTDLARTRRRRALGITGAAVAGIAALTLMGAWVVSALRNDALIDRAGVQADAAARVLRETPDRGTADLGPVMPALAATRALASGDTLADPWAHLGLYQGDKLATAAHQSYRRMLVDGLQPRLALRIEARLRGLSDDRELLYESLKTYLMMNDAKRFDAAALKAYLLADLQASLPRETGGEERQALEAHVDALLAQGAVVSPVPPDTALVAQVRNRLAALPLPERVYSRLKREGVGADLPEFTVARAAGPAAALVFTRISGQPLTRGVPGAYTHDGYHKAFQKEVERATKQLADEEGWVLGTATAAATLTDPLALQRATDAVRRLYLIDYAAIWERFIGDIRLLPTGSLAQSVQMARILSAPDTPLVPLMRALSRETTLSVQADASAAAKAGDRARSAIDESRERLSKLFGNGSAPGPVAREARIESLVDDRFTALRQFATAPEGQPAPMDSAVALLNEVYTALVAADTAVKSGAVAPVSDVSNKVKAQADRMPEPVRSMMSAISASGNSAAMGASRANLSAAVRASIGDFCRQALTGRYPFTRGSSREVTQDDFARLFAVGGLFDDFFQKNLANFVDTSTRPWSFRQLGDSRLGADAGTLVQFQRAAAIRDTFFRSGGKTPGLRLDFKPVEMDTSITQFLLDVDGQVVRYAHGPQIPAQVQWPGPGGSGQVRVELSPQTAGSASGAVVEGPWALFRLFDRLKLEPGDSPERFRVTFNIDGRKAVFDVTTSSVQNPFRLRELGEFACPGGL